MLRPNAAPEAGHAERRRRAIVPQFADASKAHHDVYGKGFSLIASKEGKVFDLKGEIDQADGRVRDAARSNDFGRAALMARRLVEAGVSAVEINLGGWDTHNQTFNAHGHPPAARARQAAWAPSSRTLVDRGMWQNTVVVWMGEFGRTPRINQNAGRDHWARCWSVVVGGGAMQGGQAYGSTDEDGMAVADDPVRIADVFATVYKGMGIDPSTQVRDAIGRPFAIAGLTGRPLAPLFGAGALPLRQPRKANQGR